MRLTDVLGCAVIIVGGGSLLALWWWLLTSLGHPEAVWLCQLVRLCS